mmetsp:Transcript_16330/g.33605  ORF Transcript_16330/g.33605 Transcript_16330/m.33605 type:complete len:203 (+) Transcript_16330:1479-2087(+)
MRRERSSMVGFEVSLSFFSYSACCCSFLCICDFATIVSLAPTSPASAAMTVSLSSIECVGLSAASCCILLISLAASFFRAFSTSFLDLGAIMGLKSHSLVAWIISLSLASLNLSSLSCWCFVIRELKLEAELVVVSAEEADSEELSLLVFLPFVVAKVGLNDSSAISSFSFSFLSLASLASFFFCMFADLSAMDSVLFDTIL